MKKKQKKEKKKKQILITACSMEIGGIERSLTGLLGAFDYEKYDVDLLLCSQKGELLSLLPVECNILSEIPCLACLQKPNKSVLLSGHVLLALLRLYSKAKISLNPAVKQREFGKEVGASLTQAYWDSTVLLMPRLKKEYDAALSFMWPHHFIAKKVHAKIKIAWVHTDYSGIAINVGKDEKIWKMFDSIVAVSDDCTEIFSTVYPAFRAKTLTIENVLSKDFVEKQARAYLPEEMSGDKCVKLLSVGRFCYAKAFDFAVEVCKRLIDDDMKVKWYLIGYGTDEQLIREKIQKLSLEDSFIILGKKTNPYPYINACDIYVQPSRYEGKAVTVREAQMLGKPVVITDYKTARSQVKNGFDAIVSPMNARAVTNDILRLAQDDFLRNALSVNAQASDYSNSDHIKRLYALIEGGENS